MIAMADEDRVSVEVAAISILILPRLGSLFVPLTGLEQGLVALQ